MTLYLKYRPQKIEELDLSSVREQFSSLLKSNEIPHAFLFTGPRGSGKTSAARILAKVLNCEDKKGLTEPCNKCESCKAIETGHSVDVIEIDAASHRGIDDVRALRENVALSPSYSNKKVYIIDEAHMLTTEAANAFLKTLEEPPEHVAFVLATTDPQKLPETVKSRLTTINFQKATDDEIERQLKRVIKGEKLKVEDEVLPLIISKSDGSFRESVKLLEQVSLGKEQIKLVDAQALIASVSTADTSQFIEHLRSRDTAQAIQWIADCIEKGAKPEEITKEAIKQLRGELLESPESETIEMLELLMEAEGKSTKSGIPQLPLEIAAIKCCSLGETKIQEKEVKKVQALPQEEKVDSVKKGDSGAVNKKKKSVQSDFDEMTWGKILSKVRDHDAKTEALLRAAKPLNFDGSILNVGVYYQFHKEKLETNKIMVELEEICADVMGQPTRLSYELTERDEKPAKKEPDALAGAPDGDIINAAKEIFG